MMGRDQDRTPSVGVHHSQHYGNSDVTTADPDATQEGHVRPVDQGGSRMWCSEFRDQVLEYTGRGWRLFPCVPNEKRPLVSDWQRLATTDLVELAGFWHKWPRANVAVACGPSELVVVDVDVHGDVDGSRSWSDLVDVLGVDVERTLSDRTPRGGVHRFYHSAAVHRCRVGVRPGVDVRADGGYVLLPPSTVGGGCYRWVDPTADVLELPGALADVIDARPLIPTMPTTAAGSVGLEFWYSRALERARPGSRNVMCYWLACQARDQGVPLDQVLALAFRWVRDVPRGDHVFSVREFIATVKSAYSGVARDQARRLP